MRKVFVSLAVAGSFLLSTQMAGAKGIFITPGTRANGVGGSYHAIADDPTAIYWNPAGLAQLKGSGAEVSFFYTGTNAESNKGVGNVASPVTRNGDFALFDVNEIIAGSLLVAGNLAGAATYAGAEPSSYSSDKIFRTSALIPFISGYTNYKDITFALGLYGVGGGGGKWDGTAGNAVTASLDALQSFAIYNLSAAKPVTDKVMVGLGVDFVAMGDHKTAIKDYVSATGTPASYSARIDYNATGTGIQVNGGVLYKATDKLQAGLVLRSGANIKLHGQARLLSSGVSTTLGLPASFQTDYDQTYNYPMTYGAGVSYAATKKLLLTAGLDFNRYSSVKEDDTTYATELRNGTGLFLPAGYIPVFVNGGAKVEWKDTTQYRIGAEYLLTDQWAVRAGIQTDPVPFETNSQYSLFNTNQYNLTYYTVGAGYKISAFDLNVAYARGMTDKPGSAGSSFDYPLNIYRLSGAYKF